METDPEGRATVEQVETSVQTDPVPFVKWAGGKRASIRALENNDLLVPNDIFSDYIEIFAGGAALFFHIKPEQGVLNDLNGELINTYSMLKDNPDQIIRILEQIERQHKSSDTTTQENLYYRVRGLDRDKEDFALIGEGFRAARFIYLNRTCYNGLYRVNSDGEFNVPIGEYKDPTICDSENLRAVSQALEGTTLYNRDFRDLSDIVSQGDFVYCDPPYMPVSPTSKFTGYTSDDFTKDDQADLIDICHEWSDRGAYVLLSQSDTPTSRELFQDAGFRAKRLEVARRINCQGEGRDSVQELAITNYNPGSFDLLD